MDWNQLTQKQKILAVFIGIGILLLLFLFMVFTKKDNTLEVAAINDTQRLMETEQKDEAKIYIEIVGHVRFPGVYLVNKNLLVIEALELAGGFTENADLNFIHKDLKLSVLIEPNQKIYIPGKGELKSMLNSTTNVSGKININTASLEELITIPGIGTATATKIIEYRPYSSIEDITKVPGIGEGTLNKIVTYITV